MHNYPDLAGYWIDNDNEYWEQTGLYERIRAERPDMTLSNNNQDTPIMDMVSHEQKVGMTPPYDYPAAVWTPMPRLTEGEWKLPTKGAWWYDGTDAEVDYPVTVGRIITNAGASVKSLMAETAMVNGRFPPRQERFNDFLAGYLPRSGSRSTASRAAATCTAACSRGPGTTAPTGPSR
jgi:alpha-L-fucosidase